MAKNRQFNSGKLGQSGGAGIVLVLLLLVLGLGAFSGWLWLNGNGETPEQQLTVAVSEARRLQREEDQARFDEERQSPYRRYEAPDIYGDITVRFPKNWNLYVQDDSEKATEIDLYMNPDFIRIQAGVDTVYAFRMQLNDELFDEQNQNFAEAARDGDLKASSITVSGLEGVLYDGEIAKGHEGLLAVLPYRDKTLVLWTESRQYADEFTQILQRTEISR